MSLACSPLEHRPSLTRHIYDGEITMPKPQNRKPPIAVGAATGPPAISVEDGPFGSQLPCTVANAPAQCYVRAQAWLADQLTPDDNNDVLDYWVAIGDPIQAGPTAHWSGGAATGRAQLIQFTVIPGQDLVQTVLAETTFNVTD